MTAPTLAERTGRIRALIEALETKGYRVPAEQLRHASYVPGWSVRVHGHGLYNVDVAGQASAVLTRDDTLALLLARWVEAARAEVYAHENDVDDDVTPTEAPVTDGITEVARLEAHGGVGLGLGPLQVLPAISVPDALFIPDDNNDGGLILDAARARLLRDALDAFLRGAP